MPSASPSKYIPSQDFLEFGFGALFQPERVVDWLGLENQDITRATKIPLSSLWCGGSLSTQARDRLEEIAVVCNLVAEIFDGDLPKTSAWFKALNPILGDVSPRDMVRLGRFDRLRTFVFGALDERAGPNLSAD